MGRAGPQCGLVGQSGEFFVAEMGIVQCSVCFDEFLF